MVTPDSEAFHFLQFSTPPTPTHTFPHLSVGPGQGGPDEIINSGMEALRRRSALTASSSSRQTQAPSRRVTLAVRPRLRRDCTRIRAASEDDEDVQEQQEHEEYVPHSLEHPELWEREQFMWDNSYAINNKFNKEPDFDDPEWQQKVTDWGEFW